MAAIVNNAGVDATFYYFSTGETHHATGTAEKKNNELQQAA